MCSGLFHGELGTVPRRLSSLGVYDRVAGCYDGAEGSRLVERICISNTHSLLEHA